MLYKCKTAELNYLLNYNLRSITCILKKHKHRSIPSQLHCNHQCCFLIVLPCLLPSQRKVPTVCIDTGTNIYILIKANFLKKYICVCVRIYIYALQCVSKLEILGYFTELCCELTTAHFLLLLYQFEIKKIHWIALFWLHKISQTQTSENHMELPLPLYRLDTWPGQRIKRENLKVSHARVNIIGTHPIKLLLRCPLLAYNFPTKNNIDLLMIVSHDYFRTNTKR